MVVKSQGGSKFDWLCICVVVLPSPPAEVAWPEACVSQNELLTIVSCEEPTNPPVLLDPLAVASPVE